MTLGGEATSAEGFGRPDEVLEVPADLDAPVEGERARLAYAIHDGLTQVVTASVLELESLAHRVEVAPSEAVEALRRAVDELRRALGEIRGVLANLTPATPGDGAADRGAPAERPGPLAAPGDVVDRGRPGRGLAVGPGGGILGDPGGHRERREARRRP